MEKLVIISNMFPNKIKLYNGIFVLKQIEEIQKTKKYNITVINPVPFSPKILWFNKKWKMYGQVKTKEIINSIIVYHPKYLCIGSHYFMALRCITNTVSTLIILNKIFKKNEHFIIHSHGLQIGGTASAIISSNYRNSTSFCTIHGSDLNHYPFKGFLVNMFTKFSLNKNNYIITVSKALKTKCIRINSKFSKKTYVVTNGVDINEFNIKSNEKQILNKMKYEIKSKIRLLFIGNLIKEKGLYELLNAFKILTKYYNNKVKLLIIGIGREKGNFIKWCYKNNLANEILFIGDVPHNKIKLFINFSDIVILPSYSEGMPTVMFETMVCSKPIIITDVGGVREIIKNYYNGILIQPKSINDIVNKTQMLIDNKKLRYRIGINAYNTIINKYTWEKSAQELINIYKTIPLKYKRNLK